VLLGEAGTRRWVALTVIAAMAVDRPGELLINALARAKFAEAACRLAGPPSRAGEFFIMGMLSRLEAIMGVPLSNVLKNLTLAHDTKAALLGKGSPSGLPAIVLNVIELYEAGEWEIVHERTRAVTMNAKLLDQAYLESLLWADTIISG
jgi:c-di-GMP-related signal transduction protein